MGDMMIPFIMLLIITIALMLERKYYEETIRKEYDKNFENWKKHASCDTVKTKQKCKRLVGLVFEEDYKLTIEVLDQDIVSKLEKNKYNIKS